LKERSKGSITPPVNVQCVYCTQRIRSNPVYIGQEMYRHRRCVPGSKRWKESTGPKTVAGEILKLYAKDNPKEEDTDGGNN